MCLIAVAWRHHAEYPLVVVANRDEFFARPAREAHWWDGQDLLAGRDEQAGGTWLGITSGGRFAALTNFRRVDRSQPAAENPQRRSRGALVTDCLLAEDGAAFAKRIAGDADEYDGFSMLYGDAADGGDMHYYSNRGAPCPALAPGVYGLSNALLDVPWPKVGYIKSAMADALAQRRLDSDALLELLDNRRRAADEALPDTGVGIETERFLSPPFIVSPGYGTRCSTVLLVGRDGHAHFHERSFDAAGLRSADREFSWRLGESPPALAHADGAR